MTDKDIIEYFFYYRNNERINHKKLENIPSNILTYLIKRFNDSDSILETIVRIRKHIENKPICPICGKKLVFTNNISKPYNKSCIECNNKLKQLSYKNTCLKKYNVVNISKLDYIKEKKKETCMKNYGVYFPMQSNELSTKIKQTKLNKYGNCNNIDKINKTKLKKYNDENYFGFGSQKYKENLIKLYGVDNISKLKEIQDKINNTKQKNNSFNISKPEDESYELLKSKYHDVKKQYRSKLYPFNCDFYIPSLDLYIECNYHWTHGFHPYDLNNIEDQNKLELWKSKQTKYYNNAIKTWTIRDINKRHIAKENKLKYLELWNIEELKYWLKNKKVVN